MFDSPNGGTLRRAEGSSSRLRNWSCCSGQRRHHATVSERACETRGDGSSSSTISDSVCNPLCDGPRRFGKILPSPSVIIRPAYLHERTRQLSRGKKVAAKPLFGNSQQWADANAVFPGIRQLSVRQRGPERDLSFRRDGP